MRSGVGILDWAKWSYTRSKVKESSVKSVVWGKKGKCGPMVCGQFISEK